MNNLLLYQCNLSLAVEFIILFSYPKFGNGTDCLSFFDPADEKEIEVKVYSYNNTKDEYIRNIVYKLHLLCQTLIFSDKSLKLPFV